MPKKENKNIIIYASENGEIKLDVSIDGETVWLSLDQIAELFGRDKSVISRHIKNIFNNKELDFKSVVAKNATTASDGRVYQVDYYNLDMIISIGYRVNSVRATQFRVWATKVLKEYIIKGFTLDDERLKQGSNRARYFEELLQRIRDIRSSERNFYQKITDIYTTSIDYRKDDKMTQDFFTTVQNKIHFATHGRTAAELIIKRADSTKPLMGLTSFKGKFITVNDIKIAKNYLTEKELKQLNLIVSFYLDFAELQAFNEKPMKMSDWISKLDEFLKLSEKGVLNNPGNISVEKATKKAETEFTKYKKEQDNKYISDFDRAIKKYIKDKK